MLPSAAMLEVLLVTEMALMELLPVVPVLVVEDCPVIDLELPPQPASSAAPIQAMINNLRMS
ncbi:MAG: hypothetical protein M3N97_06365 [Pseudomonadota bacterium]|nr:hypothetical protein [Pseudomonadota bacterium]